MLVQHFLENSAARLQDKVYLICGDTRMTYAGVNAAAERLASALLEMGVARQDRVIIFLDNSVESVIAMFGIMKAGCIFVMLNATMKAKKLNYILNDSGARVMITHTAKTRIITDSVCQAPELEHIIWCSNAGQKIASGNTSKSLKSSVSWESLFKNPADKPLLPRLIDLDIATIIYTSGSTGEPKGVVSAHYNVVAAATSISTYLKNTEDDIIMNVLPLSFDYGLYQVIMTALFGGTVIIEKSFVYPYKIIECLIEEQASGFPIVPTMVALLLQMEDLSKYDFSSLRYISNTAAALPEVYIRKLRKLFPHVAIYSMYGLTECKRVAYLPPEEIDRKPGSVGIAMPNEEVFIVDPDGNPVEPGTVGELVVRGANVMQGYWNAPEATARTYRPGKYRSEALLYTGDLFKMDEEGFLYFVARKDDMIKTKGERVSPKEIESALCEMDGVIEAAVIGVPDDIFGQAIKAFIVREKGAGYL